MEKNKFSAYFIFISILTFITVLVSMIQKSYFNLIKPQKLTEKSVLLKEINSNLDQTVLSNIELRDKNTDDNFDYSIIKIPGQETPTITQIIIPTPTITNQTAQP